jgi:tetratricopeptide (TPR) repeat protein
MAKSKKSPSEKDNLQSVGVTLNKVENFVETKQKAIMYVAIAILVIILGIVAYNNFIRKPKIKEAWAEAFKAEYYFEIDSFSLALNGDGVYPGFINIIDEYSNTPMGNAAKYYAGVCYMRLGNFEEAISVLKKFKSDDPAVTPQAEALIGDAYVELGELDKAVKQYLKAADKANNEFLSPEYLMKAGQTYELLNNYKKALETYQIIENDYYNSPQQRNIEKYIQRAKMNL